MTANEKHERAPESQAQPTDQAHAQKLSKAGTEGTADKNLQHTVEQTAEKAGQAVLDKHFGPTPLIVDTAHNPAVGATESARWNGKDNSGQKPATGMDLDPKHIKEQMQQFQEAQDPSHGHGFIPPELQPPIAPGGGGHDFPTPPTFPSDGGFPIPPHPPGGDIPGPIPIPIPEFPTYPSGDLPVDKLDPSQHVPIEQTEHNPEQQTETRESSESRSTKVNDDGSKTSYDKQGRPIRVDYPDPPGGHESIRYGKDGEPDKIETFDKNDQPKLLLVRSSGRGVHPTTWMDQQANNHKMDVHVSDDGTVTTVEGKKQHHYNTDGSED